MFGKIFLFFATKNTSGFHWITNSIKTCVLSTFLSRAFASNRTYFPFQVQLSTWPVAVCYGVGKDQAQANNDAARNALNYLKLMTKKSAGGNTGNNNGAQATSGSVTAANGKQPETARASGKSGKAK